MVREINREVGRTPSSASDPWSDSSTALKTEADAGVGCGHCIEQPGGPPYMADFLNKLLGPETRGAGIKATPGLK